MNKIRNDLIFLIKNDILAANEYKLTGYDERVLNYVERDIYDGPLA